MIGKAHHHQPRAVDAQRVQQRRAPRIAVEHPLAAQQRLLHAHRILVHGGKCHALAGQDAPHRLTDTAITADDDVPAQFRRRAAHFQQIGRRRRRLVTVPQDERRDGAVVAHDQRRQRHAQHDAGRHHTGGGRLHQPVGACHRQQGKTKLAALCQQQPRPQ